MTEHKNAFVGWAVLELFGHRRLAGLVSEQEVAGAAFVRIDVPGSGESVLMTQFYNPTAVYSLTPVTEEIAKSVAASHQPRPVQQWELPASELAIPIGNDVPWEARDYEPGDEDDFDDE